MPIELNKIEQVRSFSVTSKYKYGTSLIVGLNSGSVRVTLFDEGCVCGFMNLEYEDALELGKTVVQLVEDR